MEWKLSVTRPSGKLRKQFSSWTIPKTIRDLLSVHDGMVCLVKMNLGEFQFVFKPKITSGGEFRVPNQVANKLKTLATQDTEKHIIITIDRSINEEDHFESEVRKSTSNSSDERQKRLENAKKLPKATSTTSLVFERNPDVVAEVPFQAQGVCRLCGEKAPFHRKSDGSPYLEVHHKIRIVDGGEDAIENAIALCPNCHRKEHFG